MKYLYHHRTQGLNVEGVHIRSICNALVAEGHQVQLVSVNNIDDDFSAQVKKKGENSNTKFSALKSLVKTIPEPVFEILEIFYNVYAFFRLWYVIHNFKPDRIYERYSLYLFSSIILAKLYSIPLVYEINDSAQLERLRALYFKSFAAFIEQRVFSYANGLVFISKELEKIILTAYPTVKSLSIVTSNAADKKIFHSDAEKKEQSKDKLGLTNQVVCGYIGCFASWHKIDKFIEDIAQRLKLNPRLTLLLIGEGETLSNIRDIKKKHQLGEQVVITGNIPHEEMINYIRTMDFSVLPSANEYCSPVKMFELMGAGVPLIAIHTPPIAEIIEDNKDGWLFPRNDLSACINKVLEIQGDSNRIQSAARLAEDKIHNQHQWSNNVLDLDKLYLSSLRQSNQQNNLG